MAKKRYLRIVTIFSAMLAWVSFSFVQAAYSFDFSSDPIFMPTTQPSTTPCPTGTTAPSPSPPSPSPPVGNCNGTNAESYAESIIKSREGYVNHVYNDSLGKPTVCYGHLVLPSDGLSAGQTVTKAQCDTMFASDFGTHWSQAQADASGASVCDPCLTAALANANYQLGSFKTKFPGAYAMIQAGNYSGASAAVGGSLWARQTPNRVADFQAALQSAKKC